MRKLSILLYFSILSILFLTSCGKDPVTPDTPPSGDFNATTTDYVKGSAKTTLEGFTPLWKAGDRITVVGSDSIPRWCWTPKDSTSTAYFKYDTVPATAVSGPYFAIYPYNLYVSPTRVMIPLSYTSATGAFTNAPMYASSDNTDLTFHNLCGLVRITITGPEAKDLYYVTLGTNKFINGIFEMQENPDDPDHPKLSYVKGGSSTTILHITNPAQSDGNFYIPIPAGEYNSLGVFLTTYSHTSATVFLNDGNPVTIRQNSITPFVLNDVTFSPIGE